MSYDPGEEGTGDDVPFTLDALNLSHDTSLQHFLSSLEELIGHGQKEYLLLSALGHTRDIDQRLLEEAKVPIYQKKPSAVAADDNDGNASTDSSASTSPAATPSSASSSASSAPLSSLTKDSKQAELIAQKKMEAEMRKKAEKKEKMKKWYDSLHHNLTARPYRLCGSALTCCTVVSAV